MFCELRIVRKFTDPLLASGTTATKKAINRPRKIHGQIRLKRMIGRCIRDSIGVAVIAARLSTGIGHEFAILHERKPADSFH
jgi:hypothetical protein